MRRAALGMAVGAALATSLVVTGIAWATPGTSVGSANLAIENVQVAQVYQGVDSITMEADCPAGKKVLTGHAIGVRDSVGGSRIFQRVQGSALDADSWTATIDVTTSQYWTFIVTATCV